MERDYRMQAPCADDALAAALGMVDALEDFYCCDRQLLRLKCPRTVLLMRLAGWLNLALAERQVIDLYAVDAVRTGRDLNLAVHGRHQARRLMILDLRLKNAPPDRLKKLCGREKCRYRFGLLAILERDRYRINWHIPDPGLEEAMTPGLYCRMKKAEFQTGAEAAHFYRTPRKIVWK